MWVCACVPSTKEPNVFFIHRTYLLTYPLKVERERERERQRERETETERERDRERERETERERQTDRNREEERGGMRSAFSIQFRLKKFTSSKIIELVWTSILIASESIGEGRGRGEGTGQIWIKAPPPFRLNGSTKKNFPNWIC